MNCCFITLSFSTALFLSISTVFILQTALPVTSLGINYGQIANNLPTPDNVIPLVKSLGATKVKLYDASPQVLRAFSNTGIEFIVGLGNEYLSKMRDPKPALAWVKTNVQAYLPYTNITCITIGNEVLTFNDTILTSHLLPAMQNIHAALVSLKLDKQVSVTTPHSLSILETSYPPSSGRFRGDLVNCLIPILDFHVKIGSLLLINAYPYFAYKGNPKHVSLDFVLLQDNKGVVDSGSGLRYHNMLFAQVDAVYSALCELGYERLPVQVSETGWPSKGDADEAGANAESARKYNDNLIKLMKEKKGTPKRPECNLNPYIFALFNENMKPGPTSERNYGLFKPDGAPVYTLSSVSAASSGQISGGNSSSGTAKVPHPSPESSSTGYLSISAAEGSKGSLNGHVILPLIGGIYYCYRTVMSSCCR